MDKNDLKERYRKLDEMIKRWENFNIKYMEEYKYAMHIIIQWEKERDSILKELNKE